jgi:hypothetical protein
VVAVLILDIVGQGGIGGERSAVELHRQNVPSLRRPGEESGELDRLGRVRRLAPAGG